MPNGSDDQRLYNTGHKDGEREGFKAGFNAGVEAVQKATEDALKMAHEWIENILPGGGVSLDHKIGEYKECDICAAWLQLRTLKREA